MPFRAFRVNIPVLVEDAHNNHALAVHDKISLIVEAPSQIEAVRRLEAAIAERLPVGFTFMTVTASLQVHLFTRIHWLEPNDTGGERVHRHLDGRYEGVNRETGALRFGTFMEFRTPSTSWDGRPTVVIGARFEIPFEDLVDHRVVDWEHDEVEGVASDQMRMDVHVSGHFLGVDHDEGGVVLHVTERYVRGVASGP